MKKAVLTLIILAASISALAFQKSPQQFTVGDPKAMAAQVEKNKALKMTRLEMQTKQELTRLRLFDQKKFYELKRNELENSALYQSYINEIDEALKGQNIKAKAVKGENYFAKYVYGKTRIDLAKKIAKKEMMDLISNNWSKLKETIFNEYSVETRAQALEITADKMKENFVYFPRKNSSTYLFKFDSSFVEIDKNTLKKGRMALDIDSRLDNNTLAADADHIVPDDADGKTLGAASSKSEGGFPSEIRQAKQTTKNVEKAQAPVPVDNTPGPADVINLENF